MPAKKAEVEPWAEVHVALIGPMYNKINKTTGKGLPIELTLTVTTFINHAIGWFEIAQVPDHENL